MDGARGRGRRPPSHFGVLGFVLRATATLALLVPGGCNDGRADEAVEQPRPVRTLVIGPSGAEPLRYTGVVRARIESELGFRVGGKITERLVDAGDRVRRGQPLMRLDPVDLGLAATAAGDRLRAAEASAARAAADEARLRGLVEAGAISASAYDSALAARRTTAAELGAARAGAREAANQRAYATLVADADGIVMDVLAEPGQVVSAGAPVLRLGRAGAPEAVVAVPETDVARLPRSGQAQLYGSPIRLPAVLREVSGAADPATRTFEARYQLTGRSNPPLGTTITVSLPTQEPPALAVPLAAVHDRGRGPGVWDMRDGRVSFRPVRVVSFDEETARIAPGALRVGDRIVALGANLLREGQAVKAVDATTRPGS